MLNEKQSILPSYIAIKLFYLKNLFIVILFIFVIVFVFIRTANAESVEDVINKYIAARGGIDKLNSIDSIVFEGTTIVRGNIVPIKITQVQGKLFRKDIRFAGNSGFTIITPKKGWDYDPFSSYAPEEIPQWKLQTFKNELDILNPLVNYYSKGYKAKLLGKDILYDRECYKIQLNSGQGKESFYFIDCKTYLLLQSREKRESNGKTYGNSPETITNFRSYKKFSGVLFPQIIETESAEGKVDSLLFYEIETNIPVDEELYLPLM